MVSVEAAVLWTHIAAGVVALVAGTGALITTKGGRRHRLAGKAYVASMGVVVGSVLPLFVFEPGDAFLQFLLLVAVFSGYLVFSGYRVVSRKRPGDGPERVDWVAAGAAIIACLGLAGMGVGRVLRGDPFGVVMVVFGAIGGAFGGTDVRALRRGGTDARIPDHLSRMIGGFIATVTAVSAVNLTAVPAVVAWLWPTAVGVPLIVYWQRRYGG